MEQNIAIGLLILWNVIQFFYFKAAIQEKQEEVKNELKKTARLKKYNDGSYDLMDSEGERIILDL